jgi:hypothetical protein
VSYGLDYPADAPGSAYHQWDAASRRRYNVSRGTSNPQWNDPQADPAGAPLDSGSMISDWTRNTAMGDSGARITAARTAARTSAGGDPALAAYGGLNALLSGQGETARQANAGALALTQQDNQRRWEEYMSRLRQKWAEEQAKSANSASLWGTIGQVGGAALAAAL